VASNKTSMLQMVRIKKGTQFERLSVVFKGLSILLFS
jgi:hypothetical protein